MIFFYDDMNYAPNSSSAKYQSAEVNKVVANDLKVVGRFWSDDVEE